jgi:hypothetical protein
MVQEQRRSDIVEASVKKVCAICQICCFDWDARQKNSKKNKNQTCKK